MEVVDLKYLILFSEPKIVWSRYCDELDFFLVFLLSHTQLMRFFLVTVLMDLVKGWEVAFLSQKK